MAGECHGCCCTSFEIAWRSTFEIGPTDNTRVRNRFRCENRDAFEDRGTKVALKVGLPLLPNGEVLSIAIVNLAALIRYLCYYKMATERT